MDRQFARLKIRPIHESPAKNHLLPASYFSLCMIGPAILFVYLGYFLPYLNP